MLSWIRNLFGKPKDADGDYDEEACREWHDNKTAFLERKLGKEHDIVMHAIIPYTCGGGLDLYYYPNGIPGTAVATKELSETPNEGSSNSVYRSYELVMFTKHLLSLDDAEDETTAFGKTHENINSILNLIARYSESAQLNPNETCEFPEDMERVGGKCLIFDGYGRFTDELAKDFGILLIIEIFRSEMQYAREHGGAALIEKLQANGHYPYSDMEREPVA